MSKILVDEGLFDTLLTKELDWDSYDDLPPSDDEYYEDKETFLSLIHDILYNLCQFAVDWLSSIEGLLFLGAISSITTSFFRNIDKSLTDVLYTYVDEIDGIVDKAFRNGFKDALKKLNIRAEPSAMNLMESNTLKYVKQTNFDSIVNLTNDLKQGIRKVLYDGIANGDDVETIKNNLLELPLEKLPTSKFTPAQRAEMIAKTEYMRAYHRGAIYTYKQVGITHVRILNHGTNICDYCIGLAHSGVFTIEEALYLLPAHPRCKCTYEPVIDDSFDPSLLDLANYSYYT